jgi:O-antigen ligase
VSGAFFSSWRDTAPGLGRNNVLAASAVAFAGAVVSYTLVHGSSKMLLLVAGSVFLGLGCVWPRLVLGLIVVLTVCLSETSYGVENPGFRLASYTLKPLNLNTYEFLVYALFVILMARRLMDGRKVALPKSIVVPSLAFASVFVFQFARGLTNGISYQDVAHPWNARYVLAGVAALWCFSQLLDTPKMRLRLLDLLFVLATGRAIYALVQYFFGGGDAANAYRALGVKVALWESADHVLFTLLIVIAIAGWATQRLERTRLSLWMPASAIMALTIVLSFRRTGWLGLLAALVVAVFFLARRSRRVVALLPGLFAAAAGIMAVSYQRFVGAGSLLGRLLPDLVSQQGPTRQDEWALAWNTVARDPLAGEITARRSGDFFAFWDTRIVHNAFLFAWMKFGLIGLLALSCLVLACGRCAYKGVRSRDIEEHVALGVLGIAPFVLLLTTTGTPLIEIRMMLVLAVAGSLGVHVGMQGTMEPKRPAIRPSCALGSECAPGVQDGS